MTIDQIRQTYAGDPTREWDRLQSTPLTRTEYLITSHCLERYLPPAGLVLDAGSGPRRYAIDLARRGCSVVMLDLVRELLQLGQLKLAEAGIDGHALSQVEGNIVALPCGDRAFDAVISLGAPLSHLTDAQARFRAIAEMARVVKPGGCVLVTGLARVACYRAFVYWLNRERLEQVGTPQARASGILHGWVTSYAFAPGELAELVHGTGLQVVDQIGCEGIAAYLPMDHLAQVEADPALWPIWRDILLETCNEPTIIGISNHLLVVARKTE
ncbi:MAG: methyltransferase domain-containing protein [Chloroflexi bacterium]|nr:methyltransferase domain-containing protein [Chloroflexota bacterium]